MIIEPIIYNEEENSLITGFNNFPPEKKIGSYWSEEAIADLKTRIKTYYINKQRNYCCYCRTHIPSNNHRYWDVEHVVARASHPQFMFTEKNLSVSCPDCNGAKGDKACMVNNKRKTYPKASKDFKIIHPHFDNFDDHIKKHHFIYVPKTDKGRLTIYTCDLLRFAQHFIKWENSATDTRFEEEIDIIFDESSNSAEETIESIFEGLN